MKQIVKKIIIAEECIAVTFFCALSFMQTASADTLQNMRGDYNGDSSVTIEDAQLTLAAYTERVAGNTAEITESQLRAADINMNGAVDAADAQYILQYYTDNTLTGNPVSWQELLFPNAQFLEDGWVISESGARNVLLNFEQGSSDGRATLQAYWMDISNQKDYIFDGDLLEFEVSIREDAPGGIYPVEICYSDFSNYSANTDSNAEIVKNVQCRTGYICINQNPPAIPPLTDAMTLTAGTVPAQAGETVRMRIRIDNNPGIAAFVVRMKYDDEIMTFENCGAGYDLFQEAGLTTYPVGYAW